jgi:predicted nucleotidyltransferase
MKTLKQFCEEIEYPTKNELHHLLTNVYRENLYKALYATSTLAHIKFKVLNMSIVGSEAKGTAKPDSDLDIAVTIPKLGERISALDFSETYHATFHSNEDMPHWKDKRIDFQFFYQNDPTFQKYNKIEL